MRTVHFAQADFVDMVSNMSDLVQCVDDTGLFVYVNNGWRETLGYSDADLETLPLWDIIHPDWLSHCREVFADVVAGEFVQGVEAVFISKNGRQVVVEGNITPRFGPDGAFISTRGIFRDVTERRRVESVLRESEERYRLLFTRMQQGLAVLETVCDSSGRVVDLRYVDCNASFEAMADLRRTDIMGKTVRELFPNTPASGIEAMAGVALSGEPYRGEYRVRRLGKVFDEVIYSPREGQVASILTDITERKQAEESLGQANEILRAINTYSLDQSNVSGSQELTRLILKQISDYAKAPFAAITEYDESKRVLRVQHVHTTSEVMETVLRLAGKGVLQLEVPIDETAHRDLISAPIGHRFSLHELTKGVVPQSLSSVLHRATGIDRFIASVLVAHGQVMATVVIGLRKGQEAPSTSFFESFAHISAFSLRRVRAEDRIRFISYHDQLTGLYNRHYVEDEVERLTSESGLPLAVVMADVNGLKVVNDTYGHQAGDRLLRQAAEIITGACRKEDVVVRWGGDEFVLLLPRTTAERAEAVCRRIVSRCQSTSTDNIPVSVSLGMSVLPEPGQSLDRILQAAEDDMYKNKLAESRSARSAVLNALLRALAEKSHETELHTRRMQGIAQSIGEKIGLPAPELGRLKLLITLHDIGKINIPEEILKKSGPLNDAEWALMKGHPEMGYRIARSTDEFAHIANDVAAHHERWDGQGYPRGLAGEEIPLLARITAIADAYEVMTNGRPYRSPRTNEEARQELRRCSGTQFDPRLVDAFLSLTSPPR